MAGIINIFGLIGEGDMFLGLNGNTVNDIQNQLDACKNESEITVRMSTYGGDVDAGETIYNLLKSSGKKITVEIVGQCYSIGTIIAMAADKILIAENGQFMIHPPMVDPGYSNADELREYADMAEKISDRLFNYYLKREGVSAEAIKPYFKEEKIMTAQEAIDLGLCDGMLNEKSVAIKFPMKAIAYFKPKKLSEMDIKKLFADFKNEIKELIAPAKVVDASITADGGETIYYDGDLAVGTAVFSDEAMTAAAASFTASGKKYNVEDGKVSSIEDAPVDSAEVTELKNQIAEKEAEAAKLNTKVDELTTALAEKDKALNAVNLKITDFEKMILGAEPPATPPAVNVDYDKLPNFKKRIEDRKRERELFGE